MDELPSPDCVPATAWRTTSTTYGERIASPDLKPTPAAGKRIRAHVTFQEGDREKFKEIIVCHAKRYATAVNLRRGYGIDCPANWQPHLPAPEPWAEPANTKSEGERTRWLSKARREITPSYDTWAKSASSRPGLSHQFRVEDEPLLEHSIRLTVSELPEGGISDQNTKIIAWTLIMAAGASIIMLGIFLAMQRAYIIEPI